MNLELIKDIAVWILVLFGALMAFSAAVGLHRFPDALARLHASSKPQVVATSSFLVALAIEMAEFRVVTMVIVALVFSFLLSAVSSHLMARSSYRSHRFQRKELHIDQLAEDIEKHNAPKD